MSWLLLHQGALATLATPHARVPASEVAPLRDVLALLARAETVAAESLAGAESARAEGRAVGFAHGLDEGRAAADAELAAARAAAGQETETTIAALRSDATRLALEVVRYIAGELAPEAILAGLARSALDRLGPGHVTLRVAPAQADMLARQLTARVDVRVLADPTLDRLDLVLETSQGRALAGLEPQLAQVARAWEVADAA